jgi:hypothetical protein
MVPHSIGVAFERTAPRVRAKAALPEIEPEHGNGARIAELILVSDEAAAVCRATPSRSKKLPLTRLEGYLRLIFTGGRSWTSRGADLHARGDRGRQDAAPSASHIRWKMRSPQEVNRPGVSRERYGAGSPLEDSGARRILAI